MKRLSPFFALLLACLWLSGCMLLGPDRDWQQDNSLDFPFRTELDTYAPGDTVALSLTNEINKIVSYNLCSSVLERSVDDDWETQPADFACTLELRALSPSETDTFPYPLSETLAEGRYRFTNRVEDFQNNESHHLISNTFQIR